MSHNEQNEPNEQDELQRYLEQKAKQEQEEAQAKTETPLSEYEACVLRESDRVRALIDEAQRKNNNTDN